MDVKEVCTMFDCSQSSLLTNFSRTQSTIYKKYHVLIQKKGRGKNAIYQIIKDDSRALTLFKEEETRAVMLDTNSMKEMMDLRFAVFLGIIMTPLQVFRGSYVDFLKYIQMNNTQNNRNNIKEALEFLAQKDYIHYAVDKTNKNYFFAGIYRKVEEEIKVGISMVKVCKQLADQNHKRSWVNLLKTWLGIKYLYIQDLQPYTVKDLSDLTGLSPYQIRESGKILQKAQTFITDKVYSGYMRCIGKEAMLNGFYEGNREAKVNQGS